MISLNVFFGNIFIYLLYNFSVVFNSWNPPAFSARHVYTPSDEKFFDAGFKMSDPRLSMSIRSDCFNNTPSFKKEIFGRGIPIAGHLNVKKRCLKVLLLV